MGSSFLHDVHTDLRLVSFPKLSNVLVLALLQRNMENLRHGHGRTCQQGFKKVKVLTITASTHRNVPNTLTEIIHFYRLFINVNGNRLESKFIQNRQFSHI